VRWPLWTAAERLPRASYSYTHVPDGVTMLVSRPIASYAYAVSPSATRLPPASYTNDTPPTFVYWFNPLAS